MATFVKDVVCSEEFLNDVLEALGYPIVTKDIIFGFLPQDYILSNIIGDGLEKFFTYFPIVKNITLPASSTESEVESPIENVLGIVHYYENSKENTNVNLNSGNPFYTSSQVTISSSRQNWGTPFNYNGGTFTQFQRKFYEDSVKNLAGGKQYYCKYDETTNKFIVRSKLNSNLYVQVGCFSNNVDDVPKNKRQKFLNLCEGLLMMKFARTVKLMDSDLPLEINHDDLYDEGKDLLEETEEWMQNNSTIPLMR